MLHALPHWQALLHIWQDAQIYGQQTLHTFLYEVSRCADNCIPTSACSEVDRTFRKLATLMLEAVKAETASRDQPAAAGDAQQARAFLSLAFHLQ